MTAVEVHPASLPERDANGEPYWLWRYEGFHTNGQTSIYLRRFEILSRSDKTFLIEDWNGKHRVLRGDGKRYAHETREWAWASLRYRNAKRQEILQKALLGTQVVGEHIKHLGSPPEQDYFHPQPQYEEWPF